MRLKAVAGGLKEGSGEEKVDQMLGEIEPWNSQNRYEFGLK
jgi:hypothetical protein